MAEQEQKQQDRQKQQQQQQRQQQQHPQLLSQHPSTSGLQIALHPLALLTISDYITRHTLRGLPGAIVGALLGSQSGRDIAIEHAYEVLVEPVPDAIIIDKIWFETKLQLFKETHPNKDLLGWFTTTDSPQFLPSPPHVAAHQELLQYNESLVLLVLNPSPAAALSGGGTLPLAIYESIYEAEADTDGEVDSAAAAAAAATTGATVAAASAAAATAATAAAAAKVTIGLKFVPLNFTIESGEAEMIGMDFVAKGACNASSLPNSAIATASAGTAPTAATTTTQAKSPEPTTTSKGKEKVREDKEESGKEKGKEKEGEREKDKEKEKEKDKDKDKESSGKVDVGPQNDELIANLTAKKNAITMLNARIKLLLHYLQKPPEGVPNHQILREIRSLTHSRLPLLRPAESRAFEQERLAEEGDVNLVVLLGAVTRSLEQVRSVGRKSAGIDHMTRALKKSSSTYEDGVDFPSLLGGNNGAGAGGGPGSGAGGSGRRLRSMMSGFGM